MRVASAKVASLELYGPDLSTIHHEAYGALAREAGPAIVRHLRLAGFRSGLVVDLGCGSGILARYLTTRGYDVRGVDRSPAMIRIARRVAPGVTFVKGRTETVPLPRCSAVVATGESITYLAGRWQPAALLRHHIRRVARALAPGGLFIFDTIIADRSNPMLYRTWRASEGWAVLVEVREDLGRRIVRRRITVFKRERDRYRRTDELHRVGVYDRGEVLSALRAHGFRAKCFNGYGKIALPGRRLVFVARLRE